MIDTLTIKNAVHRFLLAQVHKKTEKEHKQLVKAQEDNDHSQVSLLQEKIATVKEKYQLDLWIEQAATKMANQLKFGTHISKGVHPDAKGDNINLQTNNNLPDYLIGTHTINSKLIDANGNAAALPLAAFFEFIAAEGVSIADLILDDNVDFIASLSKNERIAKEYHQAFKKTLQNIIDSPQTHERNKQLLWPVHNEEIDSKEELGYHNIIPLHPSVFTHEVYLRINQLKFSDENKTARENRFKKNAEQTAYVTLSDLTTLQLGGTKPQNVSLLTSRQGGRNYLLPSIPPVIYHNYSFKPSKFSDSIFNKSLEYHCYQALEKIFDVIKGKNSTIKLRNLRKQAIDEILHILFSFAQHLQNNQPAGWSKDYQLNYSQKLWLDPLRSGLEGEEEFAEDRLETEWHIDIIEQFATWINNIIKSKLPNIKHDIGKTEHAEWQTEIESMSKQYERLGKGVFL